MTLNAQIIKSNGKPAFAILPYEEYETIGQSLASFDNLEDFEDYIHALKAKNATTTWHTLDDVKKELGL